ncbi:MAG: helix-turn-helix domain-containing protein [Thermomicrobiales bacterium]|nr:helix-turn-helix domain-containing protein [Thermomicrobiales bacterium]
MNDVHALLTVLAEAASIFAVSESTLSRWKHLVVTGQSLIPKPRPGRPRLVPPADEEALRQQVAAAPDATLDMHHVGERWRPAQ